MERARMDRLIDEHFGYEASDDVDGVLATLADDVTHHIVGSPYGEQHGRSAVRPLYEELFGALHGEGVEGLGRWYGDGFVVDESMWTGTVADGRLLGLPGRSGRATFRILHVFELDGDGRIRLERVWCDTTAIAAQLR
jgi:hypothetical protein